MTPSVRKTIQRFHPDVEEARVLSILGRIGSGIHHARSAIVYDHLLRTTAGDFPRLDELVDWAVNDRPSFDRYVSRGQAWRRQMERFERGPVPLQFFAEVLAAAGPRLAEYDCVVGTSHMTLCLNRSTFGFQLPSELYLEPLAGGVVLITTDDVVRSSVEDCDGERVTADDASKRIVFHVSETFAHDCRPV